MTTKTVFISGAAGGLGAAAARLLAEHDFHVFAGDLAGPALEELGQARGVTAVELDVTSPESVEAARQAVERETSGLDGVVNFAGVLEVGSLIELDDEAVTRIVGVNVLGTIRVNRTLFPLVLGRKGRIVNISSETGWQIVMPFNGPYAMTKRAIESYSDSLRRELVFLGVPVIKIQPGAFRTAMTSSIEERFTRAAERSTYFADILEKLTAMAVAQGGKAAEPDHLAGVVLEALTAPRPRAVYSVKPDRQRHALSLLPRAAADRVVELGLRTALRGAGR